MFFLRSRGMKGKLALPGKTPPGEACEGDFQTPFVRGRRSSLCDNLLRTTVASHTSAPAGSLDSSYFVVVTHNGINARFGSCAEEYMWS